MPINNHRARGEGWGRQKVSDFKMSKEAVSFIFIACVKSECIVLWSAAPSPGDRTDVYNYGAAVLGYLYSYLMECDSFEFQVNELQMKHVTHWEHGDDRRRRWQHRSISTLHLSDRYNINIINIIYTNDHLIRAVISTYVMYLWCFISQLKLLPRRMLTSIYEINGKWVNQHQIDIVDIVPVILYLLIWWICFLD